MTSSINLEYYRVFYYVAKLGSITKAAEALHLTQPAISHSVSTLEELLGNKLFLRQPHGVVLTDVGEALLPYIDSMINQINAGEKKILNIANLEEGELYLGIVETAYDSLLFDSIAAFSRKHPKIHLHFKGPNSNDIINGVSEGTIDLGLIVSPVPNANTSSIEMIPLYETQDIFIAGHRYDYLLGRSVPLSEIVGGPLITLSKTTSGRSAFDEYMDTNNYPNFKPTYTLPSPAQITSFVEHNMGIGIVLREFAKSGINEGKFFELNCCEPFPTRQLYMIISTVFPMNSACQEFIKIIQQKTPLNFGISKYPKTFK